MIPYLHGVADGLEQAHGAEHPGLIDQEQHPVRDRALALVDRVRNCADDDAPNARMLLERARSIEMNTSICPVRRSWALKLLPETRPAYGSYLSQSISLVASLNAGEGFVGQVDERPERVAHELVGRGLMDVSQPFAKRRLRLP